MKNNIIEENDKNLKLFIGSKYNYYIAEINKIIPGINLAACFFNIAWIYYRKMYIYAIPLNLVYLLIFITFPPFFVLSYFLISFLLLFRGNMFYIGFVYNQIDLIKRKYSMDIIIAEKLKSRGGVNYIYPLIPFLVFPSIMIIATKLVTVIPAKSRALSNLMVLAEKQLDHRKQKKGKYASHYNELNFDREKLKTEDKKFKYYISADPKCISFAISKLEYLTDKSLTPIIICVDENLDWNVKENTPKL